MDNITVLALAKAYARKMAAGVGDTTISVDEATQTVTFTLSSGETVSMKIHDMYDDTELRGQIIAVSQRVEQIAQEYAGLMEVIG